MMKPETQSPQVEIEAVRHRLQDAASRAAARKGQWLRPLQNSRNREQWNSLYRFERAIADTGREDKSPEA